MNLQHLCSAMSAEVYFDKANEWVYVDWAGELTLYSVQHTCLSIARCFLDHYYPRVLTSNARVTSVTWEISPWLTSDLLPALTLTGIEQMAWVVPPTLRTRNRVLDQVSLFPHVAISLFEHMDEAVAWLQQTAPEPPQTGCAPPGRCHADEQKLRYLVDGLAHHLQAGPVVAGADKQLAK